MTPQPPHDSFKTRASIFIRLNAEKGEQELAWEQFHIQYAPIIAGFARNIGVRSTDIDDVVQDVLTGFFAAAPKFAYDRARGTFRGYLKTCTWRVFQDRLGKEARMGGRTLADIDPSELQVEAIWNDVWETEKLHRAMESVRLQYQKRADSRRTFEIFEAYAILERPLKEVAEEFGVSTDTVHQAKSRISRAIKSAMDEDERG